MINKNCFGFLYFLMKRGGETKSSGPYFFVKSDKKFDWKMKTKMKFEIGFFRKATQILAFNLELFSLFVKKIHRAVCWIHLINFYFDLLVK